MEDKKLVIFDLSKGVMTHAIEAIEEPRAVLYRSDISHLEPVDPVEVRLVLRSCAPTEVMFENASGLRPKRETLTRTSVREMIQRIELGGRAGQI